MHIAKFLRRITSGPARPDILDPLDIADKIDTMFGVRYSELEDARRRIDERIQLEDEWAMLGGMSSNLECVALMQAGRYDYVSDTRPPRNEGHTKFYMRVADAKRKASAMIDRFGSQMKMVEDETAVEFFERCEAEEKYMQEKFGQFGDVAFGIGADGVRASPYTLVPPANVLTDGVMTPAPNVATTLVDPEEEMPSLADILSDDAVQSAALADADEYNWLLRCVYEDGSEYQKLYTTRAEAHLQMRNFDKRFTYLSVRKVN